MRHHTHSDLPAPQPHRASSVGIDVPPDPLPPPPVVGPSGYVATLAAHPGKTGIGIVMAIALSFLGGGELMSKADHDAEMARTAEITEIRADSKLQFQAMNAKIDRLISALDDLKLSVKVIDEHERRLIRLEGRVESIENRLSNTAKVQATWKTTYNEYCVRNPHACKGVRQ